MRIIVFWDSISEGMWDYEKGGWVHMLKMDYWKNFGYDRIIYNASISAYNSEHIINIFQSNFDALCRRDWSSEKEAKIIFAFGINDSSIFSATWKPQVSLENFVQNIKSLIDMCQKHSLIQNVIFISAINIDEVECNRDISRWSDHSYYNNTISDYNKILHDLATDTTCWYIDVFWIMNPDDFVDGLHPNTQGHQKIYMKVQEYLEKKL